MSSSPVLGSRSPSSHQCLYACGTDVLRVCLRCPSVRLIVCRCDVCACVCSANSYSNLSSSGGGGMHASAHSNHSNGASRNYNHNASSSEHSSSVPMHQTGSSNRPTVMSSGTFGNCSFGNLMNFDGTPDVRGYAMLREEGPGGGLGKPKTSFEQQ